MAFENPATERSDAAPMVDEQSSLLGNPVATDPNHGATTNADEEVPVAQELSFTKLAIVLGSVWAGVFLAAADQTIISTLAAPISSSFNSFASVAWITTGYLIALAACQPLFGKFTDIFGRCQGLLVCNALFGIGTLLCGLATNQYMMIVGRVVAGCGGGGLNAISSIVATDLVPLRKRGIVQGGGNIAYGVGGALGGLFGGAILDRIGSWRWAFLIQVPLICISALCAGLFVRIPIQKSRKPAYRRIDYLGSLTLVTSLVFFLSALNTGGSILPWTHPIVLTSLPLSLIFVLAFLYVEKKFADEPIIPLEILTDRTVVAACGNFFFMVASVFAIYYFAPLYFMLQGESTTTAGLRMMPYAGGISLGSLSAGIIMNRMGKYYSVGIGTMLLFNLSIGLMCSFTLKTPAYAQYLYFTLFGIGYGGQLTVGLLAMIAAMKRELQAVTTSASYLFRASGATIGAAVGNAVFQTSLRKKLYERLGDSEEARRVTKKVTASFDEVFKLEGWWREQVRDAFMGALNLVFWLAFGIGIAALLCTTLLREHKLHSTLERK